MAKHIQELCVTLYTKKFTHRCYILIIQIKIKTSHIYHKRLIKH